ncbi:hypothetical protein VFPPC_10427 [Pochonia chlamydosporia 170]|uniref:Small secreted protein n=1 Tax=Pochonia chlamydosporia 170 TaxID=1380566 RepID=A0A179F1L3_METCM|nr:hypothetical protein VFPPC_10427 [Pochonia chlamydosporia 170]OAQ59366.1 hypothetical protein VFPPC_10427 [Pochonia chlamydosporia 170]
MKATQSILTTLLAASSVIAAPARTIQSADILKTKADLQAQFDPAPVPKWTIEGTQRTCAEDDSSCTWHFLINTHVASKTDVNFIVNGPGASHNNGGPQNFGDFTVTSGYDPAGFTTFSAVDNKDGLIAFPAYNDAEIADGQIPADRDYDVYYLN